MRAWIKESVVSRGPRQGWTIRRAWRYCCLKCSRSVFPHTLLSTFQSIASFAYKLLLLLLLLLLLVPSLLPDDNGLTASISPITRINHLSSSIGLIDRSVSLLSASSSCLFSGSALPASYRQDQTALEGLAMTDCCLNQPTVFSSCYRSVETC